MLSECCGLTSEHDAEETAKKRVKQLVENESKPVYDTQDLWEKEGLWKPMTR